MPFRAVCSLASGVAMLPWAWAWAVLGEVETSSRATKAVWSEAMTMRLSSALVNVTRLCSSCARFQVNELKEPHTHQVNIKRLCSTALPSLAPSLRDSEGVLPLSEGEGEGPDRVKGPT